VRLPTLQGNAIIFYQFGYFFCQFGHCLSIQTSQFGRYFLVVQILSVLWWNYHCGSISWISIHMYCENLYPFFYAIEAQKDGSLDNIIEVIMNMLTSKGNLFKTTLLSKFVCFQAHGMNLFQGCKNGTIELL